MKIKLSRKLKQMASALLVVMILGGILCLFVMYYLSLVQQQNTLSVRSQAWNIAIAITEAGIEEGLQALNTKDLNLSSAGWYYDGSLYWRTNNDAGMQGNSYTVAINVSDPGTPEITARAYVALPALAYNDTGYFFAAAGVGGSKSIVSRAVRVKCSRGNLFLAAMVAKHKIDLKGNGILTDSFDSGDPWKSNFGQYDASIYAGDRGDIASNDGVVSTISVQNANIYGKAHTGPDGTVTVGSQGAVGSHAWQQAGNTGFEDGYVLQDANFTFPKTDLPYDGSTGIPLGGPQTIITVTYDYARTPTNSVYYPDPPPWSGVTTNIVSYTTNTVCPSPAPVGLFTNTIPHSSYTVPSPIPEGLTTNLVWDSSTYYPAPGTYVGTVYKSGSWYYYQRYVYSWNTYTYSWPSFSYTYNLYATNTIYTTNTYDHVLTSGDYYYSGDLSGKTIVLGDARLVLPDGLSMSGNDQITIGPSGNLKMFCGGSSCTIGGNGILNQSGVAWNFVLECTDSVKTLNFNGNGEFIGVLVAPEADATMDGGGKANNDYIGALMANSVNMNGHFSFHYDEALARTPADGRLLITSWDEIP